MFKREALRCLAVATVVAGLWCVLTGRTSATAWQVPVEYSGDAWFTLVLLRAAGDGTIGAAA